MASKRNKFDLIFYEIYPKAKNFALKILKSEEDAEDIVQDVFVKLWNTPEIWEENETWRSYVYTMIRNHIFNFLKHKAVEQKFQQYADSTEYKLSEAGDIYDQLYAKELQLLIKLTIERMPAQRRKVFVMSRHEEMSHLEIAKQLGLSVRTVERHIYLALGDLKEVICLFLFFMFITDKCVLSLSFNVSL